MDRITKLFRKISPHERVLLRTLLDELQDPDMWKQLSVKKLRGSEFFRARKGRFRIIFHTESKQVVVDSIRIRSKSTYKDF